MANSRRNTNAANDAATTNDAADAASVNAAPDAATTTVESATMLDTTNDAANDAATNDNAAAAPDAAPPVSDAVRIVNAEIDSLTVAINMLRESAPDALPALQDKLDAANGKLALALANDKLDAERIRQLDAANAAAAASGLDADTLAIMLAAIERRYAPVESAAAPVADAANDAARRLPVSDRTIAANAAAFADSAIQARAADVVAAFDADSGKLQCKVNHRPNTRFSGMVALTPSGGGVANAADYDALTRGVRAYLINVKGWQTSDGDGQTVPESKWLAARGRYVIGGGVKSALDCFHSDAEIALYADGRFRFAYRSQAASVRFLRTDNAAWTAFVTGKAASAAAPVTTPTPPVSPTTPTPPTRPTPPVSPSADSGIPQGAIVASARCQHCNVRNILTDAACENCGAADWRIA